MSSSSSSEVAAAAAAETKCEKNKNSIGNTDTDTDTDTDATATATATANTSTATATAASTTASASTTLTIDDEYDGCSSCARACGSGEEKNDNNNNNNNNNRNDLTIARAMHVIESLTSLYGFSSEAANDAMNNIALKNGNNKDSNNNNDSIDTIISLCCDYILDNGLGMDDGGAITPINNCPHVVQKIKSENDDDDNNNNTNKMCCCVLITPNDIPNTIFELSCQYYRDNNSNNNNNKNEKEKQTEKPAIIVGKFKDDIEYDDDDNKEGSIATCPKGENWCCLYCGGIYCSRYVNGHGVNHYEDTITNTNTNDNTTTSTNTTIIDSSHCCVMVGLADLSIWCHKCESYLETHNNTSLNSIINKLQQIKFD